MCAWRDRTKPGDREVRRQLRLVLRNNGLTLTPSGDLIAGAADGLDDGVDLVVDVFDSGSPPGARSGGSWP
jgi:hypothetical protein